jgi:hypothetical protein
MIFSIEIPPNFLFCLKDPVTARLVAAVQALLADESPTSRQP